MRVKMLRTVDDYREGTVVAVEAEVGQRLIADRRAESLDHGRPLPTFDLTTYQVDHLTHEAMDRATERLLRASLAYLAEHAAHAAVFAECRRLREAVGLA